MKSETSTLPLPLALRDTEITETDVAVLLRIALDKGAKVGRYKRVPKRVPAVVPTPPMPSPSAQR